MSVRKTTIVWSVALILLTCNIDVDAAKSSRRGGTKVKTPNYDHVALTYGGSHGGHKNTQQQPSHHHQYQPVQQQHHQAVQHHPVHHQPVQPHQPFPPSAPALPTNANPSANNNNRPVGWTVPAHNAPEQAKTVTNTHSALPYPQNPPPYTPNAGFNGHPPAGPPPPYSANPSLNSHVPAGPPPPYSQNPNTGFQSNVPTGQQPPAYGGAYPMHNPVGGNYPQQQYNGQPEYPQQSFAPQGQAPVINNFYGQPQSVVPQSGGSSGGGFLQTALAAGAGSLAGNALYGALKPDSESKTVIIHENAPAPAAAPAAAPVAPVTPVAAPVAPVAAGETTTNMAPAPAAGQPAPPADVRGGFAEPFPMAPNVPLAPLAPEDGITQGNPSSGIPLAPMLDTTTNAASTNAASTNAATSNAPVQETTSNMAPNQTITPTTVPLAPFPNPESQKSDATTFAILNISVYTVISIIIASAF